MIECRLLGPVEIRVGEESIDIGQPRQRAVLAALAADAGRLVPVDVLIDRVWGDNPPPSARDALYSNIARLRRALTQATTRTGTRAQVVRRSGGYLLDIDPDHVDLGHFRQLAEQARTAAHADGERVTVLRKALALWQGQPLTGISGPWAARMRQAWRQHYVDAVVAWSDAEICIGNANTIIDRLTDLAAENPLVEPLAAGLMRALYAVGRCAEALDVYAATRRQLADDLGADPGPELQDLHQAILRGDLMPHPPTAPPPAVATPPAVTPMVPALLPRDVHGFAGRGNELARLRDLLPVSDDQPATMVVSALSGTAGVGKTALAIHFAHKVAARFPDGQLYVNLHGFSPTGQQPRSPGEAIRLFLETLGVPPEKIPAGMDGQIALYRSQLAGKQMLILLDNARDADQVRPLLPGAPACLVLVTSRNQLAGLTATEGARPLVVDLLTVDEARQLLAARLGPDRIAAEPDATSEIIESCARLPLALAIVAARAAVNPTFPLATLAAELRDTQHRLDALAGDNADIDVRAVFSWSYRTLTDDAARLFRLLGLHPGPDIAAPAAASLAALPLPQVRRLLGELIRANLIVEPTPGRYTLHDLLRVYATDLAHTTDPEQQRHTATHRVLDHYLHTAYTASVLLDPCRDPITLQPPRPGVMPEESASQEETLAWFTTEHGTMLAAVDYAATTGFDTHTWQLAWSLVTFLDRRGHWHDLAAIGHSAVDAAHRLADPTGEPLARRILARAHLRLGRLDDAHTQLRHALNLFGRTGDPAGQADVHVDLARVYARQGCIAEVAHHGSQAHALYRATGHQVGQAQALTAIGWSHARLGDPEQALTCCRQALPLLQEFDDREGQAHAWGSLGLAHHHLGQHAQALACHRRALDLYRGLGVRYYEADTLTNLGDTLHAAGDLHAARDAWRHALTILTDIDHPDADTVRTKLHHPHTVRTRLHHLHHPDTDST